MKRVLALLLPLLIAIPAFAQESTATCDLDLSSAIEILQGVESTEGADALALIVSARDQLLAAEQNCAAAGVVLLDQDYTAPDEVFSLSYPHGWSVGTFTPSESGGIVFIGNSPFADRHLQVADPNIRAGEQAVQLLYGAPQSAEEASLEAVIADFEQLIGTLYEDVSTTEYFTLDGRDAARFFFRGATFDGIVVGADLGDGRFVAVRGVAASGRLESLRGVVEAIVASVR